MKDKEPNTAVSEIDWAVLLQGLARAASFDEMVSPIYASGVLVTDYEPLTDDDPDDLIEGADTAELRSLLTAYVLGDRFNPGLGEEGYWYGDLDAILDALASELGLVYPLERISHALPDRIAPCPNCGDTDKVKSVVFGMPAGMPEGTDESRVIYAGCEMVGESHPWYCPACDLSYDYPWTASTLDEWGFDSDGSRAQ